MRARNIALLNVTSLTMSITELHGQSRKQLKVPVSRIIISGQRATRVYLNANNSASDVDIEL